MDMQEFLAQIKKKNPPVHEAKIAQLEAVLGVALPGDYRQFIIQCNGGWVGGRVWFHGPTPQGEGADAGINLIDGFAEGRIYGALEWTLKWLLKNPGSEEWLVLRVMADPFGNEICLGLRGPYRGRVYFFDREREPDTDTWDGSIEDGNPQLLASSFAEFVAGLGRNTDVSPLPDD